MLKGLDALRFSAKGDNFCDPPPPQPLFTALEASTEKGSTQKESIRIPFYGKCFAADESV